MRRLLMPVIAVLLILIASPGAGEAPADLVPDEKGGPAEWTVLFYLCGSDLESSYGFATDNLIEIMACDPFGYQRTADLSMLESRGSMPGKVNVVIETGGAKNWNRNAGLPVTIEKDRLQRWDYHVGYDDAYRGYHLVQELPLACMAEPETLTDFLTWGVESYPAEKYALVLWGHGGGSKDGLFIDELFNGASMDLPELGTALQNSHTVFEAVLFDACLMANLETACAIRDSARWMIASEEVVPGEGTDVCAWLEQLYQTPDCDGARLGRWICDTTEIYYAKLDEEQAQDLMTWSVIDLSRVEKLAACLDRFFADMGKVYKSSTSMMNLYTRRMENAEEYGMVGTDNLIDIGDVFLNSHIMNIMNMDLYRELIDTLDNTVDYVVRGPGRSGARGLSFCYAVGFTDDELDNYIRSCPFPHYIALLDAVSPTWNAPDRLLAGVEKLPEIGTMEAYYSTVERCRSDDGTPALIVGEPAYNVQNLYYTLYRENEESNQTLCLGSNTLKEGKSGDGEACYYANEPWNWPAVDGTVCAIDMVKGRRILNSSLYSVPLQFGVDRGEIRVGYNQETENFTVYGVWQGYDAHTSIQNRNVISLANYAGSDYRLLYPVAGSDAYEGSEEKRMYKMVGMKLQPLPPGKYYLEYNLEDMFRHPVTLERIAFTWDGDEVHYADDLKWEGTEVLQWKGWKEDREKTPDGSAEP